MGFRKRIQSWRGNVEGTDEERDSMTEAALNLKLELSTWATHRQAGAWELTALRAGETQLLRQAGRVCSVSPKVFPTLRENQS